MKKKRQKLSVYILSFMVVLIVFGGLRALAGPLPGAIFTTLEDGSRVNHNIYLDKDDVYLDGGPGINAPASAAGLPAGDYYFQVTDPSGKVLLSEDPVKCRRFHVNEDGVIDAVYSASYEKLVYTKGKSAKHADLAVTNCTHDTGEDADHSELGAITVQLKPYADTPNKGGVYKAWITPVEMFVGDANLVDNPAFFHGFMPAWSKTDNFKVKIRKPCFATGTVYKFCDDNADGIWDVDELELSGWNIDITDPLVVTNFYYTPVTPPLTLCPAGTWTFEEALPCEWMQTALIIDGVPQLVNKLAQIEVAGDCDETHEIIFGNIKLACITACKFYDKNMNGVNDSEEPIANILFTLEGVNIRGENVSLSECTDENGCVKFCELLPGTYTLTEIMPEGNWMATTPESEEDIELTQGDALSFEFGNYCYDEGYAAFGTKGYWHNKNGLTESRSDAMRFAEILAFVNSLTPYKEPTDYFDKGDEPFDGLYENGITPVPAAKGVLEKEGIAPEGTIDAEISNFLVNSNGDGGVREQLAQQLLAFIFNVYCRVGSTSAMIAMPSGTPEPAADIIADAIAAWTSASQSECSTMVGLLDRFNNSTMVSYMVVYQEPCEFEPDPMCE